jgi:hypothetical protein
MFIEHASSGSLSSLQRSETKVGLPANLGNIALLWSANYRIQSLIYEHLALLGRREADNILWQFEVELK